MPQSLKLYQGITIPEAALRISLFKHIVLVSKDTRAMSAHQDSMGNSLKKLGSFIDGRANDVMKPPSQPSDYAWEVAESGILFSIDLFIIMRVTMFECIPCMRLGTHFAYNLSDLQNCARYVLHIIFPFFRHLPCQGHVA